MKAAQFDRMLSGYAQAVTQSINKFGGRHRESRRQAFGKVLGIVLRCTIILMSKVAAAVNAASATVSAWSETFFRKVVHPAADAASARYQQHAHPHVERLTASCQRHLGPTFMQVESQFEDAAAPLSRLQVALVAAILAALLLVSVQKISAWYEGRKDMQVKQRLMSALKALPGVRTLVQREMQKVVDIMKADVKKLDGDAPALFQLPEKGLDAKEMFAELNDRATSDFRFADGESKATGTIYMAGDEHREILNDVYCMFSQSNPLHADLFPSVRRMEAEVVQMVASLLGGGPEGNPQVCGAMTSGGTESIITAMFASLAFQRKHRGITNPEIVIANSAHAAYYKAAKYSGARLRTVAVSTRTFRLTAADVRRCLSRNTAVVVVSAVTYPHGVLDDVAGIARLCRQRGVLLHVDACLGGFVLPFMRALGRDVPPFDFAVPGVTSMSVDTHKYGLAHKGTSVVLYREPALRHAQYTSITEWTGGLYISPGLAGSRSGALIATAWAAMRHMGHEGYMRATQDIMQAADSFRDCVSAVPELRLCGEPAMCNIAFMSTSPRFDILQLNDILSAKGWHFAVLIQPPALHFCFTYQHAQVADQLCQDLLEGCKVLRSQGKPVTGGKAKLYGMASSLPDREGLADLLVAYQDIMLSP